MITANSEDQNSEDSKESKDSKTPVELSIEEAIEQAEFVFDDSDGLGTVQLEHDQEQLIELNDQEIDPAFGTKDVTHPVKVDTTESSNSVQTAVTNSTKRSSPRISPRSLANGRNSNKKVSEKSENSEIIEIDTIEEEEEEDTIADTSEDIIILENNEVDAKGQLISE